MTLLLLLACTQEHWSPPASRQRQAAPLLDTSPTWTLSSSDSEARFGESVAGAGDVNGDGYDDLLVGAPLQDEIGVASLYYGSTSGVGEGAVTLLSEGRSEGTFGSVTGLGDINGDGFDDVAVGAPGSVGPADGGSVSIYLGAAAGLSTTPSQVFGAARSYDSFGWSLAAGDINGDGQTDVVVGSPYGVVSTQLVGTVRVLINDGGSYSEATGGFYGDADSRTGFSVAAGGDVDGDGYEDLAFGVPMATGGASQSGKAYVYYGDPRWPNATYSTNFAGHEAEGAFGFSVALVGDLDDDGFTDVAFGAPFEDIGFTNAGCVYLHYGSSDRDTASLAQSFCGDSASEFFGTKVAGSPDLDADGFGEMLIGAPFGDSRFGLVQVYPGSSAGVASAPAYTLRGATANGEFGLALSWAGDTNGDGFGEIIVGQPGTLVAGQVHLFEGYIDDDGDGFHSTVDCDDQDASFFPGADERCDGLDNDCDRAIDEGVPIDALSFYADADQDGYGDPGALVQACEQPSGVVLNAEDCDDSDDQVLPGAPERCDDRDEDCDAVVDEDATDAALWYGDADNDGFGVLEQTLASCDEPAGHNGQAGDCDDDDSAIYPGAIEILGDGIDNDCDGVDDARSTKASLSGGCAGCDGGGGVQAGLLWVLLAISRRNLSGR